MKRPYMRTIIGSSKGDCVLIILFPLYGSVARPFECNLFRMSQYSSMTPPPVYWKKN